MSVLPESPVREYATRIAGLMADARDKPSGIPVAYKNADTDVVRVPTERQYRRLLVLGSGAAAFSRTLRDTKALLDHGWVTAEWDGRYYQCVRITPEGHRALAAGQERYGLPELTRPISDVPRRLRAGA